jgi:hypothetical protein
MKALKPFGLFGNHDPPQEPLPRTRVVELFRSRAELRKQQNSGRSCSACATSAAAGSRHRPHAGNVRGPESALESADDRPIYPWFSTTCAPWRRSRDHQLPGTGPGCQAGGARAQAFALEGNRRQFQPRDSEQQLRRPNRRWSRHASNSRHSMRASRVSTSGGMLAAAQVVAQRPALQAAVEAAERAARRTGALRTDREGRSGRVSGNFRRGAARDQSRRHRLRRGTVLAAWHAPAWSARRAPRCRGANRENTTEISPPALP